MHILIILNPSSCLFSSLPLNNSRRYGSGEQTRVVCFHNILTTTHILELEQPHHSRCDGHQLHIGKLLTNTAMSACTERKVRTRCTLGNETISVIKLLLFNALSS